MTGVSRMHGLSHSERRPITLLGMLLAAVGGVMMIVGGTMVVTTLSDAKPQLWPFGLSLIIGGSFLLPVTRNYLSQRWIAFSRWHVPLIAALASLFLGFVLTAILLETRQPERAKASGTPETAKGGAADAVPDDRAGFIAYVDSLLAAGDPGSTTRAMSLVHERFAADEIRGDPQIASLLERAITADQRAGQSARGQEYVERVSQRWLPQVAKIAASPPKTANELWERVGELEELGRAVADGTELKEREPARARETLKQALRAKQQAVFPALREAYGHVVRNALWQFDVEVGLSGSENRTIRLTGPRFVLNANIQETQQSLQRNLQRLRFTKAHYERYAGSGGYTYDVVAPKDDEIGFWEGAYFKDAIR